jgi:hypothetical protein
MRKRSLFVAALLVVTLHVVGFAQVKKLYPSDEAAKDPTFFIFRAKLFKAIQKKDANFIYSILDKDIQSHFGGGSGLADFKQQWRLERPNSEFWSEFSTVLSLGGGFDKDNTFTAPYTTQKWPEDEDLDEFEHAAVIEEGVRVRSEPNIRGSVIQTLSFDIVSVTNWQNKGSRTDPRKWVEVQLTDGRKGFVSDEYLRGPVGYRAYFEKKNGRWVMTAFIAGD